MSLSELFAAWEKYCRMYDYADTPALRALYGRLVIDFAFVIWGRLGR